jgi:hypothetical protein
MRDNFSINVVSVIVNSLISYYAVIKGSRPSRKLRVVRFSFDREVLRVNIFNCGDKKRRMYRMRSV